MRKETREKIAKTIRYELAKGTHTFTMCSCGRNGCRSERCWECWLDIMVHGSVSDWILGGDRDANCTKDDEVKG